MATVPLHAHGYRSHTYTFPSGTLGAHQAGLCEKLEKSKKEMEKAVDVDRFGCEKGPDSCQALEKKPHINEEI
ncbi:hypothetical protein NPIL_364851 [Nephila pilipes]|uniref:Uncharacterized protein n=1 Tax=Nephila pilipes TaxID=299642 RepID=A0A8X6IYI3_NEPPI|nr:hypothetical protein NPIL_364851 [Nephila pilipes]